MITYLYLHDDDVEVCIDIAYHAIHEKEVTHLRPEDCHDGYSDMTLEDYKIVHIRQLGDERHAVTEKEIHDEFERMRDIIEEHCWDDFDRRKDNGDE